MASVIVLLLSCVACTHGLLRHDQPSGTVRLDFASDETIELRVGASAAVPGTTSTVTFVKVVNDSRCPRGVECVWEGDAIVELRVQPRTGEAHAFELHTNDRFERQGRIDGVTVTLDHLEPYPEGESPVAADAYRVTLRLGGR